VAIVEPLQVQNHFPNLRRQYSESALPIEAAQSTTGRQTCPTVTHAGAVSDVAYSNGAGSTVPGQANET
jgi:hypothetical protein